MKDYTYPFTSFSLYNLCRFLVKIHTDKGYDVREPKTYLPEMKKLVDNYGYAKTLETIIICARICDYPFSPKFMEKYMNNPYVPKEWEF